MAKRLEIAEALSTRTVNELSEKEKMIQEQMAKRLVESEATSTRAAKKMSENKKIIQEQGNLIK